MNHRHELAYFLVPRQLRSSCRAYREFPVMILFDATSIWRPAMNSNASCLCFGGTTPALRALWTTLKKVYSFSAGFDTQTRLSASLW
jgi:hypothetical protein